MGNINVTYPPPTGTVLDFRIQFLDQSFNTEYVVHIRQFNGDQVSTASFPPTAAPAVVSQIEQMYRSCASYEPSKSGHRRFIILVRCWLLFFLCLFIGAVSGVIYVMIGGVVVVIGITVFLFSTQMAMRRAKDNLARQFLNKAASELLPSLKAQYPALTFSTLGPIYRHRGRRRNYDIYDFIRVSLGPASVTAGENIVSTTAGGIQPVQQMQQVQQVQQMQQMQQIQPMQQVQYAQPVQQMQQGQAGQPVQYVMAQPVQYVQQPGGQQMQVQYVQQPQQMMIVNAQNGQPVQMTMAQPVAGTVVAEGTQHGQYSQVPTAPPAYTSQ